MWLLGNLIQTNQRGFQLDVVCFIHFLYQALEEFYVMVQRESRARFVCQSTSQVFASTFASRPDRVCYGPKQVFEAIEKCAVQTLMAAHLFSDLVVRRLVVAGDVEFPGG